MGQLINGVWKDVWYDTQSTGGHFKRSTAQFRNWVTTVTNGAIVIHTQRLKS
ncbi:glutathione S-transferase, partial [Yersinia pestis]|nr:glutathione S-transferase [Yersinia pestis]MRO75060.1 glutathione S-transferase [Yersinia pestis]MRO91661.1 glutathione S-transferase [Yersinia pestis]MRO95826.1 glutathione S-transferase [Yersinia pestis]MRP04108.1 glutathione S-transferase [Yersinia pestis]